MQKIPKYFQTTQEVVVLCMEFQYPVLLLIFVACDFPLGWQTSLMLCELGPRGSTRPLLNMDWYFFPIADFQRKHVALPGSDVTNMAVHGSEMYYASPARRSIRVVDLVTQRGTELVVNVTKPGRVFVHKRDQRSQVDSGVKARQVRETLQRAGDKPQMTKDNFELCGQR